MKRKITQTRTFSKALDSLIKKQKLLQDDFNDFEKIIAKSPDMGDLIPGTGGFRKTRLKAANKGKRGGFRICYIDDQKNEELFLVLIYPKNEQENITSEEKKFLRELKDAIFSR